MDLVNCGNNYAVYRRGSNQNLHSSTKDCLENGRGPEMAWSLRVPLCWNTVSNKLQWLIAPLRTRSNTQALGQTSQASSVSSLVSTVGVVVNNAAAVVLLPFFFFASRFLPTSNGRGHDQHEQQACHQMCPWTVGVKNYSDRNPQIVPK